MTREKVMTGLECLTHDDFAVYATECWEHDCPYKNTDCEIAVMVDAYNLLKAQEPRVMTIGDLYGYDMGYYERKDEELVWPVLIARGGPDSDGTVGLVRKDVFEIMADCGLINQTWRIWTAYPTIDQREAAKWK